MTTLREAAQQALDRLRLYYYGSGFAEDADCITALEAALAQPAPEPETCTWHQDGDSDSGVYATSCGRYFNLEDGAPEDNRMQWCCYCGEKLAQELITEETK